MGKQRTTNRSFFLMLLISAAVIRATTDTAPVVGREPQPDGPPPTKQQLKVVPQTGPGSNGVSSAALSPNGKWMITCYAPEATPRLWELSTKKEVGQFIGHTGFVYSAAFSGDGKWVVTHGSDHTARLWDVDSGKEMRVFRHDQSINDLALSGDAKWLVMLTGSAFGYDDCAHIWDVATG